MNDTRSRRDFTRAALEAVLALSLAPMVRTAHAVGSGEVAVESHGKPLAIGIAGLTHGHVLGVLERTRGNGFEIVGLAEPNQALAKRYADQFQLGAHLFYGSLDDMIKGARPDAVAAFNSTQEHLAVVQQCALRGIHVMVEKPLAVSLEHARAMRALADKHRILLLTNYDTTWYGTYHEARRLIEHEGLIGAVRKIAVRSGHGGPQEGGADPEFLEWLTDPVKNGGGALMDFGCYGAALITWFMQGHAPESVTAITRQFKPSVYPKVDDDATIILTYPKAEGIIQASWNWPYSIKDIEIYGETGSIEANRESLVLRKAEGASKRQPWPPLIPPYDDQFHYLVAAIRREIQIAPTDLSSPELNMTVMTILDAARESARDRKTVLLNGKQAQG